MASTNHQQTLLSGVTSTLARASLASTSQTNPQVQYEPVQLAMLSSRPAPTAQALVVAPAVASVSAEVENKIRTLQQGNSELKYPLRKGFKTTNGQVLTNHFRIGVNKAMLYQYKILPALSGKNRRKIKAIIQTTIAECDFLQQNKADFATDYFDTIVSWTNLHTRLSGSQHTLLNGNGTDPNSEWQLLTLDDGNSTIHLTLKYEGLVDVQGLLGHKNLELNRANMDLQPVLRAMNILISKCFDEQPVDTVQFGANKFFLKDSSQAISNGKRQNTGQRADSHSLCTLRGYSYAVKPGTGYLLLNVNAATSAFWQPVKLSVIFEDRTLYDNWDWPDYAKRLKGVRVSILYDRGDPKKKDSYDRLNSKEGRIKTIEGLSDQPIEKQTFAKEGSTDKANVLDYLKKTHSLAINHPSHYAVNLGTRGEPRWYPSEYLQILPYQKLKGLVPDNLTAGMLETACQRPPVARALVGVEGLRAMGIVSTQGQQIDLPKCSAIVIQPRLLQIPSSRLPFPRIQYGGGNHETLSRSSWNLKNKELYKRKGNVFNVIGLSQGNLERGLSGAFHDLQRESKRYGLARLNLSKTVSVNTSSYSSMDTQLQAETAANPSIDFALMLLNKKDVQAYANFKDLADRKYGLHSVCLTTRCIGQGNAEKLANVMLKLNLKASGTNHTTVNGQISQIMPDTLVLGADVTHPSVGALQGCPSIAAIVGSVDAHAGRFLGSMRLQDASRKEIIDHVRPMVKERIIDWVKEQDKRHLPNNIIYYRDGVSDPQFREVKETEVMRIQAAFTDAQRELEKEGVIDKSPTSAVNIAAIVCVKRHNVRFYPLNGQQDSFDNCPAGTHVDSVITSPFFDEFYLQSHTALKGTAKPCRYFILQNDTDLSTDNLRQLTHELRYTYVRAPVGVSYAAPAYYADRLCERGRLYLRDMYLGGPKRHALDTYKWGEEDQREHARTAKYGKLRKADGSLRVQSPSELEQIKMDKEGIAQLCEAWTMREARSSFYGDGDAKARNPWHGHVAKTMFWM
ncbi:hypothetical protein M3J09_010708 [Ascochyta lentis]